MGAISELLLLYTALRLELSDKLFTLCALTQLVSVTLSLCSWPTPPPAALECSCISISHIKPQLPSLTACQCEGAFSQPLLLRVALRLKLSDEPLALRSLPQLHQRHTLKIAAG